MGGTGASPTHDGLTYATTVDQRELARLYSSHLAGFSQAPHMAGAGTSSVTLQATASSGSAQVVTFNHSATTFAPATSTSAKGYADIQLRENVTATTGTLTRAFATGDLERATPCSRAAALDACTHRGGRRDGEHDAERAAERDAARAGARRV